MGAVSKDCAGEVTRNNSGSVAKECKIDLLNFSRSALNVEITNRFSCSPYRSRQLFNWIYRRRVRDFDSMTDISKSFRQALADNYFIYRPEIEAISYSKDGTRKYLFKLEDGECIESVLIKQPTRFTLCISSQVGCAIGCKFCRTGTLGLRRNLTTSEIVGQVLAVQDSLELDPDTTTLQQNFKNIVFMGMGEPLQNFNAVTSALSILGDDIGLGFPPRKITVSTSGLVPKVYKLADSGNLASLAVSLNGTTDEFRSRIIPINTRYPIAELLTAVKYFAEQIGRPVTIEYVLFGGVNDTSDDIKRLANLLKGLPCKLNLIPYNNNAGMGFSSPSEDKVVEWQLAMKGHSINTTVRWSKGNDIAAACGQLAADKRGDK